MKYYHELYMSDGLIPKKQEIMNKIENDTWQPEIHLITLTKNECNHLEFFHSVLLIQKAMSKADLFVVGIAKGSGGALDLIEKITKEVYDDTKGTDIRNYIMQKQLEFEEGNV